MVFFSEHATSFWTLLSTLVSGLGAWLLRRPRRQTATKGDRSNTTVRLFCAESGQRAEFRNMLMSEITDMRHVIKEYEADTQALRERLNTALAQSLVLRGTVEIMEKRVAFFRDSDAMPVAAGMRINSATKP